MSNQAKIDALLKDETIVIDDQFVKLFVSAQEKIEGIRSYELIQYTKDILKKHEEKANNIILKSLLAQNQHYATAMSNCAYVVKMARKSLKTDQH